MKILLIGQGGREHALAWKLAQEKCELYCAPGNAGTASIGTNLALDLQNLPAIERWAIENRPDLTIVGPEAPLCAGIADRLTSHGLLVFGPSKAAARLEGSKSFAKEILQAAGVATALSASFTESHQARAYVEGVGLPLVIKADGLAAGKGVAICFTKDEAFAAITNSLDRAAFGSAGQKIVIEEFLVGQEYSALAWVDGMQAVLLPSAGDYKRVGDGDTGPNTGGMGAYSPTLAQNSDWWHALPETVFLPVIKELARRGIAYRGLLYAGMMLTAKGPYVLEFNCRFGDPETQALIPRLQGSLAEALVSCASGSFAAESVSWRPDACVTVVSCAAGYPGHYRSGAVIHGLAAVADVPDVAVFQAGTAFGPDGKIIIAGGRVLAVSALAPDVSAAAVKAYRAVEKINYEGQYYRRDIGRKIR